MGYFRTLLCILVGLTLYGEQANARIVVDNSYETLLKKSDLVVIATPITKTIDTKERSVLPDISYQEGTHQNPIPTVGEETTFSINLVLKGEPTLKQFVLHHYREANQNAIGMDGPKLVTFDPTDIAKRSSYLLFLVHESDGRYAATGGQTDPGLKSIAALPFEADTELLEKLNQMVDKKALQPLTTSSDQVKAAPQGNNAPAVNH